MQGREREVHGQGPGTERQGSAQLMVVATIGDGRLFFTSLKRFFASLFPSQGYPLPPGTYPSQMLESPDGERSPSPKPY